MTQDDETDRPMPGNGAHSADDRPEHRPMPGDRDRDSASDDDDAKADDDTKSDDTKSEDQPEGPDAEPVYNDRDKLDFDPDEGFYTGTAVTGDTDIPGEHELVDDVPEADENSSDDDDEKDDDKHDGDSA
ncbi:hypothetical protein [uncultured Jatrophihabitans sp.]|uniref:hypothetical protein n=1 Tax=uncultured Jatrophihabitans sp. TaxID=1610747 RepID=UPI0035C9AD11